MVTVDSRIPTIHIEGKLVIFPAYTFLVQKEGYKIQQRNDKVSNRKLNEILMQANLAEVLGNEEYQVPHIMMYENGVWKNLKLEGYSRVKLDAGKYGNYVYYAKLVEGHNSTEKMNAIIAFITQYSSAKIIIR